MFHLDKSDISLPLGSYPDRSEAYPELISDWLGDIDKLYQPLTKGSFLGSEACFPIRLNVDRVWIIFQVNYSYSCSTKMSIDSTLSIHK